MPYPKVWGHRGASGYSPENTMEAFQLAIEMKADGVELDVQLSKDGHLVVIHDETINRVSNGSGWVKDFTLVELREYNFNNNYPLHKHVYIPTLEEVYSLFKGTGMQLNVELKTGVVFYYGIEEKVLELTKRMGMLDMVIFSSFNHYTIKKIKTLNSSAKIGLLYRDGYIAIAEYGKLLGAEYIHPPAYGLNYPDLVKTCIDKGLRINVWNVNDADLKKCYELGVNAIITNYPDRSKKIIEGFEPIEK
ncbi:glycerophosphodiester phosphodiesterase [Paenibacillus agaridevorans]|uniref:Glycerophosphodiester phosphodiesterase n=1 Tax=Paenibacillus agaridevorans TaxID=171404 RepID=A0A2R5EN10_9BACL|nr:glycerophosphodiester phosphodiesterase [Paenibacillus agaridevorans]GBG06368.1 glycerophosphodiester phosphodiesterase [Paenibacillus agaridevorans]